MSRVQTPGQRVDELCGELHRAIAPLTRMLWTKKLSRVEALAVVAECRRVLDRMERVLKGDGNG